MIGIARYWYKEIERVIKKLLAVRDMVALQKPSVWSGEIQELIQDALDILKKGRVENEVHRVGTNWADVENRRIRDYSRSQERRHRIQLDRDNGTPKITPSIPRSIEEPK